MREILKERIPFILALYVLLAGALSSWVLLQSYFIGHDGVWYARMAENIMRGKGISVNAGEPYVDHPPFYPLVMGIANFFLNDLERSGHLASVAFFALTLVPLFLLTREMYGGRAAHWTGLLFCTNGFLLLHSNLVLPETLFLALVMTEFYLAHKIIRGQGPSVVTGLGMGVLGGLSHLARPEGLLFFLAATFSILLLASEPLRWKKNFLAAGLITFILFSLPHAAFVDQNTHKFQLSGAVTEIFIKRQLDVSHPGRYFDAKKIYEGLSEDKKRLKMDELKEGFRLGEYLSKDNYALLKSGFQSALWRLLELNKYLYAGLGFFLMGGCFFAVPWDDKRRKSEMLLLFYLATVIPQLFGIFHPKRFFLYLPIFLMWIGNGLEIASLWAKKSFPRVGAKAFWLPLIVVGCLAAGSSIYVHKTVSENPLPLEYRALGLWMKQHIPGIADEKVASRHPSVVFYSGAKLMHPPYLPYVEKFEDLLTYLAHQNARYFVVSSDLESPTRDAYQTLLDESRPLPAGIHRKHTVASNIKVILYESTDLGIENATRS